MKLRIAYLSPDFRTHSVAYFLLPLWRALDRSKFEIYAYYNNATHDATTEQLKSLADHWHNIAGAPDALVANKIYQDKIDILIDLAGHSANNRLGVMARKPAPVQMTWLGYPNTTGLSTIDYRITDPIADPPGTTDAFNSEQLIRLRDGFLCYQGHEDVQFNPALPCDTGGRFTLGSFNNYLKLSQQTYQAWASILTRLPEADLLLKSHQLHDAQSRERCWSRFESMGIARNRIKLVGKTKTLEAHLNYYQKVDLALDPFPYNGTTTTFEALWMGVPVLTCQGEVHASRVGSSILSRLGMQDFIAKSVDQYVQLAVDKSAAREQLRDCRKHLRSRLKASPLCDAKAFAQAMGDVYLEAWQTFCQQAEPA